MAQSEQRELTPFALLQRLFFLPQHYSLRQLTLFLSATEARRVTPTSNIGSESRIRGPVIIADSPATHDARTPKPS